MNYTPDKMPDEWRELLLLIPEYDCIATAPAGCWFDADAAQRAIDFFQKYIRHVEGDIAGQLFILQPWQKAVLACIFGWQRKDDKGRTVRRYREVFVFLPRGNGKALAFDTPLPTPAGWTTMGEVKAGDFLFDDNGKVCTVEDVYPVMEGNQCYRVGFSDGTSIVADAEHLWETDSRMDRDRLKGQGGKYAGPKPSIKTTEEIKNTLFVKRTLGKRHPERNHRIKVASELGLPRCELSIDPYVLGVWLGDGVTRGAGVCYSVEDLETVYHLVCSGVKVSPGSRDKRSKTTTSIISFSSDKAYCRRGHLRKENANAKGRCLACERATDHARRYRLPMPFVQSPRFKDVLRKLGVIDNKHIPSQYLRASAPQRLALLQGLMDTDGYVSKDGQCEFTTTLPILRDGFLELARSLGFKPTLKTARATVYGKDCGEKYRIQFWSFQDGMQAFRMSRKASRLRKSPGDSRTKYRQIVSVDPVPSVPVRCIKVDSPSHLYLAGEAMIPTHNTCIVAGLCVYVLLCDGERGAQIYGAAAEREQAALLFRQAKGMIEQDDKLGKRCKIYGGMGHRSITLADDSTSSYRVLSADVASKHGFNTHAAFIDELHALPNRDLVDVLKTSMGKANRKQPLMVYLTTSDYDRPSICNEKHDYADKVRKGVVEDAEFLPVIYQAEREDDWRDEAVWAKANPNLGISVKLEYLRSECKQAKEVPAYENTFRRLHLNQRTTTNEKCIPMDQWDACKTVVNLDDLLGRECYLGLDIGSTSDFTALLLFFPHNDSELVTVPLSPLEERLVGGESRMVTRRSYTVLSYFWLPSEPVKRDPRMTAQINAWQRQGFIRVTPGDVVDYPQVVLDILEIVQPYNLQGIAFDKGFQGVQTGTDLIYHFSDDRVRYFSQGILSMAPPFRELLELLAAGRIHHDGNPVLRWMASNTVGENRGGLVKPSKDKSAEKIDGITAMTMALAWAMSVPTVDWYVPGQGL